MRVHVLGVCGTFMAGVALLARELGHEVTGSDAGCYEPMKGQLARAGVKRLGGYAGRLPPADLYIVGNAISRGNPQLEKILAAGRPYCSGPEWLQREFLARQRQVVAVAGTHGKTTTSAMLVHALEGLGLDPGYLVGGMLAGQRPSARLGAGKIAVVEADEYDSACWDKRPKFAHYRPDLAIVTNIEFDHADIYPDLAAVQHQFALLPRYLKPGGRMLINARDRRSQRTFTPAAWFELLAYNQRGGLGFRGADLVDSETGTRWRDAASSLPPGVHNRSNALACLQACASLTQSDLGACLQALRGCELPARRLQQLRRTGSWTLYDDFAHHPTAIAATLAALQEMHPQGRLTAIFEPRSRTMLMGRWRQRLAPALAPAARVYAHEPANLDWSLRAALRPLARRARVFAEVDALREAVVKEARAGDVMVMLSNGDFSGLRASLPRALAART